MFVEMDPATILALLLTVVLSVLVTFVAIKDIKSPNIPVEDVTQDNTNQEATVSIDALPPGGHKYGFTNTGYTIDNVSNKTCTTSRQSVADAYPHLTIQSISDAVHNAALVEELTPDGTMRNRRGVVDTGVAERVNRIVGGGKTNIREFPWLVSLQVHSAHVCGGSMILPDWVLSAAHCTNAYRRPKDWQILAGVSNSRDYSDGAREAKATHIFQHKLFDETTYDHDITLLKMDKKFTWGERLQPVCMPHPEHHAFTTGDENKLDCYVAGFGTIWAGGPPSGSLLAVALPQVNNELCNKWFLEATNGQASDWITDNMLCAGYEQGRLDACQGDSGGPLTCIRQSSTEQEHRSKTWYISGAVSWGMDCAKAKQPGVYTRLILYYDYVWKVVEKNIQDAQFKEPGFYQVA